MQEKSGLYETALAAVQTPMDGYMPELKDFHHIDFYTFDSMPAGQAQREAVCNLLNKAIINSGLKIPEDKSLLGKALFSPDNSKGKAGITFNKVKGLDAKEMSDTVCDMIATAYYKTLIDWKNSIKIFPDTKSSFVEYRGLGNNSVNKVIDFLGYNFAVLNKFHEIKDLPDIRVESDVKDFSQKIYMNKDALEKYKNLEKNFEKYVKMPPQI